MDRERALRLRKETLTELTPNELGRVVAGLSDLAGCTYTVDVENCLRQTLTACPDFYCTGTC
jgi:hypothetical protein